MATRKKPVYKKVLLKLSGEAMMGSQQHGIDAEMCASLAAQIKEVSDMGVRVSLVVGGGNIFRGQVASKAFGLDRSVADYMGMLATMMNSIALQDAIERHGATVRVISALHIREVAEPYIRRRAVRHLEKGRILIFAAGTGNPYFTTDTAASLRAMEIQADAVLKGTKVDGVYTSDPAKNPDAVRYDTLTFTEALTKRLGVMDATAMSLCRDNQMPIVVFDVTTPGQMLKAVSGEPVGTLVQEG